MSYIKSGVFNSGNFKYAISFALHPVTLPYGLLGGMGGGKIRPHLKYDIKYGVFILAISNRFAISLAL